MCRHLAYLGRPESLQRVLLEPEHSLASQSWAPRFQTHGVVNVDGFGAGWYVDRSEPVRYRRAQPIWTDASFASLAPTIASTCVLAAVRSGSEGFGHEESSAAPFTEGPWLFSHNGKVEDWPAVRREFAAATYDVPDAAAPVDSALLFGLAVSHWRQGATLAAGLSSVVADIARVGGGRLNLLAVNGDELAATTYGERLFLLERPEGVTLASEPSDDTEDWTEIPDRHLVLADKAGVTITALTDLT